MPMNKELLQQMITKSVAQSLNDVKNPKEILCEPEVKILADSITEEDYRLTTFQLKYQRFILAELNTHRMFSRNSRSSRATPIAKNIEQVKNSPWGPYSWGMNQKGMSASTEADEKVTKLAKYIWNNSSGSMAMMAESLEKLGIHKQIANRILEPFMPVDTVLSGTDFKNFWRLRIAEGAQPEMRHLAEKMKEVYDASKPVLCTEDMMHLPYVSEEEKNTLDIDILPKVSAARCARVSYTCFDGTTSIEKDLELFNKLVDNGHFSPLEHVAMPVTDYSKYIPSNFRGWNQLRKYYEGEFVSDYDSI